MPRAAHTAVRSIWLTAAHASIAVLACGLVLIGGPASAQLGRALSTPAIEAPAVDPPSGWAFDLSAQTSLPLSVGVEAQLTTPVGITAQLAVGHTPNAYLDAVASALGDADVYADRVRPLIDDAIASGGWNVRAGLGLTVFDGLELAFGYTYLTASTDLRPDSVERALNRRIPWPAGMGDIPLSLSIHALHGRVGWRFLIEQHLVIRVALGWTHAVASEAHLDVPPEVREGDSDPATRMEDAIEAGLGEHGFTPELVLSAGYRF